MCRGPPPVARRAAARGCLLLLLLAFAATTTTASPPSPPRRALLQSPFFEEVTIRITCNGGGLQPLGGDALDATAEAFRASLGWINEQRGRDAFTVRSARLVRPPIAGPGTATISIRIAARADAVDELVKLAVEKVDNQIIAGAMRERGVAGLWKADLVDASTRPLGARRADATTVATGTVWQGYGPDANAPASVLGGGDSGGGGGDGEVEAGGPPGGGEQAPQQAPPPPPQPPVTPPPPAATEAAKPTTPPPTTTVAAPPMTPPPTAAPTTPPPTATPTPTIAPTPIPPRTIDLNLAVQENEEIAPPGSSGGAPNAAAAVRDAIAAQLGVPPSDVFVSYADAGPKPQLQGGRRRLRQAVSVEVSQAGAAAAAPAAPAAPAVPPTKTTTFRIRVTPQTSKAAVGALKAANAAAADPATAAAWREALTRAGLTSAAGVGVSGVEASGLTRDEEKAGAARLASSPSSSSRLSKGAIAGIVVGCLAALALAAGVAKACCGRAAPKGAALTASRRRRGGLALDRKASGVLPPGGAPVDGTTLLSPERQTLTYDSVLEDAAREVAAGGGGGLSSPTRPNAGGVAGAAFAPPPSPPEVVALRAEHARLVADADAQAAIAAAEAARQAKAEARAAAAAVQAASLRAALTAADSRVPGSGSTPASASAAAQAASHAAARALAAEADAETAAREAELAATIAASAAGEAALLASERDAAARDLKKIRSGGGGMGRAAAAAAGVVRGLRSPRQASSQPTSPPAFGEGA